MAMNSKKLSSRANSYLGIVTLVVILAVVGLTSEMFGWISLPASNSP
jgi:hypothetical protein